MTMKEYQLLLVCAVVLGGHIHPAGATVTVDESMAKDLLRRGKAELVAGQADDAESESEENDGIDLDKLTKAQLVALADQLEIETTTKMTNAELIAAIEAHGHAE